jgi:hypothetical protein
VLVEPTLPLDGKSDGDILQLEFGLALEPHGGDIVAEPPEHIT